MVYGKISWCNQGISVEFAHRVASVVVPRATAKDGASVGLGTAPVGSLGRRDRVRVNSVILSHSHAREGRGGEENGGVEHIRNKDLRAQALGATALGKRIGHCAFMRVIIDRPTASSDVIAYLWIKSQRCAVLLNLVFVRDEELRGLVFG